MSSCSLKSFTELTENLSSVIAKYDGNQILDFVTFGDDAKWLLQWKLLANLRKRSSSGLEKLLDHEHTEEIKWILDDPQLLELLLCSGYVQEHRWVEVIEIICRILAIDPAASCGYKSRLAAAVALTFSTPVKSLADQSVEIDPIERYNSFTSWADADELFHNFKDLTAWQMRYVIGSWATDDELIWAREKVPLEFKSPSCIGEATHSMMKYRESNEEGVSVHDGARYYSYRPVTMSVMYEVGAVCGGISKFGCAMAQAFGIPAMPLGQPGHCAFLWWKEGEWVLSNDVSGLGKSVVHDGIQWTWDKNADFVHLMEHSQKSFRRFVLSEKLRIAAKFCSKGIALELLGSAINYSSSNYLVWRDLAELCMNQNINQLSEMWMLSMIQELDYFNQTARSTSKLLSKGSIVKVSDCHDRRQNIVDGTQSEWWTSKENAWVEIDLGLDCIVTDVKIQWWGTSVSKNYIVYAAQKDGTYKEMRKTIDEVEKPTGYNGWSSLPGWTMKTTRVKFILEGGSLDPWGKGRWLGIRQILILGRRERVFKLLAKSKTVKMGGSQKVAQNITEISNLKVWAEDMTAWVEIKLGQLCFLEKIELQWREDASVKEIMLLVCVDGRDFESILLKSFDVAHEYCGKTVLPINKVASFVRLKLGSTIHDQGNMKKCLCLQNVAIFGEEVSVKHLLIEKAREELSAWPCVEDHVCSMLYESGFQLLSSMATCRTSDCHERAQNIIDGTQSEWWSESQDAWVEIVLKEQSQIHGVKIQWWGTSVSRDLRIYVVNEKGELNKVKTSADEINSPVDYNDWSTFNGWDAMTKTIRFELKSGSLDPWGMGKYFGIRQIIVTGLCCS